MIVKRDCQQRGMTDIAWLKSYHTFSFGQYFDPDHQHFSTLRVINDDYIEPGMGFGTHPHRDMEIITVVLEGAIAHRDSMGNESVVNAGDIQVMSAGTGIQHSEYNPSSTEKTHLYQIWIEPSAKNTVPRWEEARNTAEDDGIHHLISPVGEGGALTIGSDASLYRVNISPAKTYELPVEEGRSCWIQVLTGEGALNGEPFVEGDGFGITPDVSEVSGTPREEHTRLHIKAGENGAQVLFFDLPH